MKRPGAATLTAHASVHRPESGDVGGYARAAGRQSLGQRLVSVDRPDSEEVVSARLGDLVEHADRLVDVVWDLRAGIRERSGYLLVSEMRVLLKKEPPPVGNVGGVNDRLQSGPVEGTAKEDPGCRYDLTERLPGEADTERPRELLGDRGD